MHSSKAVPSPSSSFTHAAGPAWRAVASRQLRSIPPPLSCATRVPVPRPVAVGRRRAPLGKTAKGRVVRFLWDVRGLNGRCSHATRECWMERSGLSNASTTVFLASHGLRALFVLLLFYARFDFLQMRPPVLLFLLQ